MRRYVLALFVLSCNPQVSPNRSARTYYADPEFSPSEIRQIQAAASVWETYSGGSLRVNIVQSDSPHGYKIVHGSTASPSVALIEGISGMSVLGVAEDDAMTLTMDRLPTDSELFEVAIHEFGHTFGMRHTPNDPKSIMFPTHRPGTRCPTMTDMAEFCRVVDCDFRSVTWCTPR